MTHGQRNRQYLIQQLIYNTCHLSGGHSGIKAVIHDISTDLRIEYSARVLSHDSEITF